MKRNLLLLTVCSLIILIIYRFPTGTGQVRYSMELAFRALIAVILIGVTWRANRYIAAFLGLALLSQFYPLFCSESARAFYNVLCGVILYTIIVMYGKGWVNSLMDMMCIIALANVVIIIFQVCGIHLVWQNAGSAITGMMENPNSMSALLALCFPAFLRDRWRLFSPLVLFGLFAAGSSGGLFAVMIGLSFYFLITQNERKYLYPISMGLIIIVGVFVMFFDTHQSLSVRTEVWSRAWELFTQHWLFGCGLGRWKTEFLYVVAYQDFPQGFIRLHSTTLQSMVEMGIGFAIILAGYLINIARRSWINIIQLAIPLTALIIILANGSVNFLIRIAPNAALVVVWLSIMELSLRDVETGRDTFLKYVLSDREVIKRRKEIEEA